MEHLIAAITFVASSTALVVIGFVEVNHALDEWSYRRRVNRRLRAISQVFR